MNQTVDSQADLERADFVQALAAHRDFLRFTVRDLTDDQAVQRTTVSELWLGGLVKHVCKVEEQWVDFIVNGPAAVGGMDEAAMESHAASFQVRQGETLKGLLDRYDELADRTEELVRELPTLDVSQPLPDAPWFPPDARWTARRVLLHIIAETAQHAGHADIIREALDGQKTMG
jgi:uncharacterized damage-inducible protein DinB